MAAPPLLVRAFPYLRLYLLLNPTLPAAVCSLVRRPCHTTTSTESPRPIRKPPSNTTTTYDDKARTSSLTAKQHSQKDSKWENDPDYRKWKDKESEILLDIDPITLLIKDILHSDSYMDGEQLTSIDEKMMVEKVLAYHPYSEDKIGCGLDFIMVDRHPQFRNSICLFAVRTDGIWIDFFFTRNAFALTLDKNTLLMQKDSSKNITSAVVNFVNSFHYPKPKFSGWLVKPIRPFGSSSEQILKFYSQSRTLVDHLVQWW